MSGQSEFRSLDPDLWRPVADALWDGNPAEATGYRLVKWTSVEVATWTALDAVPDGWAKVDGEWTHIGGNGSS